MSDAAVQVDARETEDEEPECVDASEVVQVEEEDQLQLQCQNAGNSIPELLDFKIFWGTMPPDPPNRRGLMAPKFLQPPTSIGPAAYLKSY